MSRQEFDKLCKACGRSLDRLRRESEQTLALMLLVAQFPEDVERRTALELQRHREDLAQSDYRQRRRALFRALDCQNGQQNSPTASKSAVAG
jgi:uncharacterized protein (DUF924 family)